MRGQEPGSDHERNEAGGSAAPATPPPSFGQTSGRDISPAPALHEEAADAEATFAVPTFQGSQPGLEDPAGTQPWEVPADDATAYDWLTDPTQSDPAGLAPTPATLPDRHPHPSHFRPSPTTPFHPHHPHPGPHHPGPNATQPGPAAPNSPQPDHPGPDDVPRADGEAAMPPWPGQQQPTWPAKPVVPGAPPWEPPPAFTAAAAGMKVWPAPLTDPHAMPPWPAATGELVAEPDEPDDQAPAFDPNSTNPEGFTQPAHYFDPEAAKRDAAHQDAAHHDNTRPAAFTQDPTPNTQESRPNPTQIGSMPLAAPVPVQHEDTHPFTHEDIARPIPPDPAQPTKPAHYFDPEVAKQDAHLFSPHPTNPSARPAEPGDVPVWPPTPQGTEKLPDLPFPRETWGQRHTTSLELPSPEAAYPAGAFKQPPFQTPPPPPPPGRSKRALFVTLGALALAGMATGGFFAYRAVSNPAPTTAAARPTPSAPARTEVATSAPPADVTGASVLNSEATDPQKLSLSEAFPEKKVSAAGTTFTRIKTGMETTCDKAATGAFADALREQKCSRVLRATYVDSKRRYAVTTGIAVLPTKAAATTADAAKDLSHNVWFRPLPGADGSGGERVHIAGGYAAGLVWGRYIVFSYATHADGHTPEAKEKTLPKVSGAFRDQTSLVLERRVTGG
ncbi:hypothetical protein ABGB18_39345 [Nonomuraea sp. B12E4]|uniref:hypothetical protein n=1 Tax=Nonomuraea sp. B12E4 TaxID=3153564 RepID=UPI00325E7A74